MNLIRIEKVQELTTFGKSTIWELAGEEQGTFPKARKLSPRVTVWLESEVIEWIKLQFNNHSKLPKNKVK